MRKFKNTRYLLQFIVILMSQLTLAFGQKLPKVQITNMRAPENIKIDGEITEWSGQFQAYNLANHLYYTVSNDDNNIYLTLHMDDMVGSRKIFQGGLTFTIITSSKKADNLSITFPGIVKRGTNEMEQIGFSPFQYKILKEDTIANKTKIDSLIISSNKLISKFCNQILVRNIPGTNDPLISVYNTQGIKVGARFDKRMKYTYELAIPLKYLAAAINNGEKFKYNIKLNTAPGPEVKTVQFSEPIVLKYVGPSSPEDLFLYNDTDFSGEYILANKK